MSMCVNTRVCVCVFDLTVASAVSTRAGSKQKRTAGSGALAVQAQLLLPGFCSGRTELHNTASADKMLVNGPRWTRCCRAMLNSVHSVSRGTVGVRRTLLHPGSPATAGTSYRGKKDDTRLFTPIPIRPSPDDINVGAELTGALDKAEMLKVILKFSNRKEIKFLCLENGIDCK